MNMERRFLKTSVRASRRGKSDAMVIEGIASPFNQHAQMPQGFVERVMPGAFAGVIQRATDGSADVACLWNHSDSQPLGRVSNATLTLAERKDGLYYCCILPDTQFAKDLYTSIQRRDVCESSIGFALGPGDDTWDECDPSAIDDLDISSDQRRCIRRTITNFTALRDVSPVTFPAYGTGTSVDARNDSAIVLPETCPAEFRSALLARRENSADVLRERRRTFITTVVLG